MKAVRAIPAGLLAFALTAAPAAAGLHGHGVFVAPYTGLVATRLGIPNSSGGFTAFMTVTAHVATSTISTGVVVCHANASMGDAGTGETAVTGTTTYSDSIEYPIGTIDQHLLFSGVATGSAPSGGTACTDPSTALATPIPAGATFNVRSYQTNPSTLAFSDVRNTALGDKLVVSGATDQTGSTGGAAPTVTDNVGGADSVPVLVIAAQTTDPSVILIGDSICKGFITTWGPDFREGIFATAIASTIPVLNLCSVGESYKNWLTAGFGTGGTANATARHGALAYASSYILEMGINDFAINGSPAATVQTFAQDAITEIVAANSKAKITLTTITTEPSSTTGFTDTAGQTADNPASIATYNGFVTGGSISGDNNGYFDVAGAIQSAGKWKLSPNARSVADGVTTSGSNTYASASANFTSSDIGSTVYITHAGLTDVAGEILTVPDSTHITVGAIVTGYLATPTAKNASASTTAATIAIGGLTFDGTHPDNYVDKTFLPASGAITGSRLVYP